MFLLLSVVGIAEKDMRSVAPYGVYAPFPSSDGIGLPVVGIFVMIAGSNPDKYILSAVPFVVYAPLFSTSMSMFISSMSNILFGGMFGTKFICSPCVPVLYSLDAVCFASCVVVGAHDVIRSRPIIVNTKFFLLIISSLFVVLYTVCIINFLFLLGCFGYAYGFWL